MSALQLSAKNTGLALGVPVLSLLLFGPLSALELSAPGAPMLALSAPSTMAMGLGETTPALSFHNKKMSLALVQTVIATGGGGAAQISKTLSRDGNDVLLSVSDANGTKTITRDGNGVQTGSIGTGSYKNVSLVRNGNGRIIERVVS